VSDGGAAGELLCWTDLRALFPCVCHTQRNAISYFNFLNDEGRSVVGALLPAGS
jgi:hypothetical protein